MFIAMSAVLPMRQCFRSRQSCLQIYISALSKEVTRIPKIRHKSFSFNNDEDDKSDSDSVEENKDIEKEIKIQQLPKVQPSRSKGKQKSILEKLVREPELGKNSSLN